MADSLGRDVIVNTVSWDTTLSALEKTDTDFNNALSKYLEIMHKLTYYGIIHGTRHDNLVDFYEAAVELKDVSTEVYKSVKRIIQQQLISAVESADTYPRS